MRNILDAKIEAYIEQHTCPDDILLKNLLRDTYLKTLKPHMVSGVVQGQFLELFAQALKPKNILEIGTFTGYAAIKLARGLAPEGVLDTIELNEEFTLFWDAYFKKAGLEDKICVHLGSAESIIPVLKHTYDLVFIDADKKKYSVYYDLVFDKVKKGGYIIADNTLWFGKVINEKKDKNTLSIDAFNKKVQADVRVSNVLLSVRDGLMIIRKNV